MAKILIIDPLTLRGREALQLLAEDPFLSADVRYFHSSADNEHQIAELAGEPALVPPLDDPSALAGADAILVASDLVTPRLAHVAEFGVEQPSVPIVVMGRPPGTWDELAPAAGADPSRTAVQVRIAHPALVALWTLVESLRHLDPTWASVAALDPVSAGGTEDIERLARQAAQRLQGAEVEERIGGLVLAFTLVAADDEDLNRDAGMLLPGLTVVASRTATGCFHGHAAHINIGFATQVEEHEVLDALRDDDRFSDPDLPISLDSCAESDRIGLSIPRLAPSGRMLSVTAMVDGLRIGGARTALEVLRSLL